MDATHWMLAALISFVVVITVGGFLAMARILRKDEAIDAATFLALRDLRERHWRAHVQHMLRGMDPHVPPVLLLDPIAARQFVDRGGFAKKAALVDWLHATATLPAGEYWDYQLIQNYVYPRATFGEEPYASKLKAKDDEIIKMFTRDEINVVVVGGETNGYWRIFGANRQKTASVDDWR